VVDKALGAGAVPPHRREAATVQVLAVDHRRIVELVAARSTAVGSDPRSARLPTACHPSLSGSGKGTGSRLCADSLLAAHPCNQLRLFH
jgi:hypothetical protein